MKYIVMQRKIGDMIKEVPIIFPNEIVHQHMALALLKLPRNPYNFINKVIAAGDYDCEADYGEVRCSGRSESLNVASRGKEDAYLILDCEYGAGVKNAE